MKGMAHRGTVPPSYLGAGSVPGRYAQDPMPERVPCTTCAGLGFVSLLEADLPKWFNIAVGLTRVARPGGKTTWEGDCQFCKGKGMVRK